LDLNNLRPGWEGVTNRISVEEFTSVFPWWYERCPKCIEINNDNVEKTEK
jgi:hypothetical protein